MKTLHNSNLLIGLIFLFALGVISSCETETKKQNDSTSNPIDGEKENID